jgi:hypothetical protein
MIIGFTITSSLIVLLSYLYGGLETVLAPYQFHMARSMEYIAFPVLIDNWLRGLLGAQANIPFYFLFFFILQVSTPILALFIKFDSPNTLIHYSIIAVGLFILFSRIWSPQWFLWLVPFLIISARSMKTVCLIMAYDLITYLSFPILFNFYGSSSYQLQASGLLTYLILFIILVRSVKILKPASIFAKLKTEKIHLT